MISFFRNIFSSKIGVFLTLAFVGVIAIAFATADVSGSGAFGGVTGSGTAVKVGDQKLSTSELSQSVNNAFRAEQRENTGLDLKSYVDGGGFDGILDRLINSFAIADFANKYGITAGKRLVDSEIANIPSFQGADGQFNEENFRRALQQQGLKEQQLRDDIARNLIADQLLPVAGFGAAVPQKLVLPYASLLLESRQGKIAIIPSAAFVDITEPSDAALQAFYTKNSTKYTIPERRSLRYALFSKSRFEGKINPSEKEIEGYFKLNSDKYAASENRNLEQIILPTEAAAKALASKISSGMTMTAAARSVGLSASEMSAVNKARLAENSSQAVADAAFRAASGTVAKPAQSQLGWHLVKVNGIKQVPGKSLSDVRNQIVTELSRKKIDEALANLTVTMEDEFAGGASLADIAKAEALEIQATPLLLANGQNPDDANYKPVPEMQRILPIAFQIEEGGDPQVVEIIPGEQYAVVDVSQITPSAPPALVKVKKLVVRDYILEQGSKKAKQIADRIAAQVSKGVPLAKAMADAKVQLPPVEVVKATRAELAQKSQQGRVPPPLTLMFSMAKGTAKTLRAPQNQGWFIVSLDEIKKGDAKGNSELIKATSGQFKQVFGNEYTEQFINAMKQDIGIKRNENAINALKAQLTGRTSGAN